MGYNNYLRSGKFYLLTADTKTAVYHNIVEQIVVKSKNISPKEFKTTEGKIALKWLKDNKINFDAPYKYNCIELSGTLWNFSKSISVIVESLSMS